MEITESMVYWLTRLTAIKIATITFFSIMATMFIIWLIILAINRDDVFKEEDKAKYKKPIIQVTVLTALMCLLTGLSGVFIPTTKTMCVIKVLPIIAQNDNVKQLPDKLVNLADEWINELSPKKNNSDN